MYCAAIVASKHRIVVRRMTVIKKEKNVTEKKIKRWNLRKEESCEFREELLKVLVIKQELLDDWTTTATTHIAKFGPHTVLIL